MVFRIGEEINNQAAFEAAIEAASSNIPFGGTCPSAAMERALGMIMATDLLARPFKAAVLLTDGVFYDNPKPKIVEKGFKYCELKYRRRNSYYILTPSSVGVLTYALGIAIPSNGNNNGLTPEEMILQQNDLMAFTNKNADRIYNLGADGLGLLNTIGSDIIARLNTDVTPVSFPKPYYCSFTSKSRYVQIISTNS